MESTSTNCIACFYSDTATVRIARVDTVVLNGRVLDGYCGVCTKLEVDIETAVVSTTLTIGSITVICNTDTAEGSIVQFLEVQTFDRVACEYCSIHSHVVQSCFVRSGTVEGIAAHTVQVIAE